MTRYSAKTREQLKKMVIGKKIVDQEYCEDGDYYTIILDTDDRTEFSFRFMADLQ